MLCGSTHPTFRKFTALSSQWHPTHKVVQKTKCGYASASSFLTCKISTKYYMHGRQCRNNERINDGSTTLETANWQQSGKIGYFQFICIPVSTLSIKLLLNVWDAKWIPPRKSSYSTVYTSSTAPDSSPSLDQLKTSHLSQPLRKTIQYTCWRSAASHKYTNTNAHKYTHCCAPSLTTVRMHCWQYRVI